MTECPICKRKVVQGSEFCEYHGIASENVHNTFDSWTAAMKISWEDYLIRLMDEENLGKFARDVVEYLIQQDDSSK